MFLNPSVFVGISLLMSLFSCNKITQNIKSELKPIKNGSWIKVKIDIDGLEYYLAIGNDKIVKFINPGRDSNDELTSLFYKDNILSVKNKNNICLQGTGSQNLGVCESENGVSQQFNINENNGSYIIVPKEDENYAIGVGDFEFSIDGYRAKLVKMGNNDVKPEELFRMRIETSSMPFSRPKN